MNGGVGRRSDKRRYQVNNPAHSAPLCWDQSLIHAHFCSTACSHTLPASSNLGTGTLSALSNPPIGRQRQKLGSAAEGRKAHQRNQACHKKPSAGTPWTRDQAPHPRTHKHHARHCSLTYCRRDCTGCRTPASSAAFFEPPHGTWGFTGMSLTPPSSSFLLSPTRIPADDTQLYPGCRRGEKADELVHRHQ